MKVKYVTIQHFVKDDVTPPVTIDIERVFFVEIPYKLNEEETKKFVDIVQQHNPFIYYRKVPSETTTTVLDEPTDKIAVTGKIRPKEQEYILEGVFYALAEIRRERDSWYLRAQRKIIDMFESMINGVFGWLNKRVENLKTRTDKFHDLDEQIEKAKQDRESLRRLREMAKAEEERRKRVEETEREIKTLKKDVAELKSNSVEMLKTLTELKKFAEQRRGEMYYDDGR